MVSVHHSSGMPVEDLVFTELDRELPQELEDALEEHLRVCGPCRELRMRHRRVHEQLHTPMHAIAFDRARTEVWAAIEARRSLPQRRALGLLGRVAFAAAVALVAGLIGVVLAERAAPVASPAPLREVVAKTSFELPDGGTGTLVIQQGSALARVGERTGVGARAELVFARAPRTGAAEIRFKGEGDLSYGVLGSAPELADRTRAGFGGNFPRPAATGPVTYEVWLHLEMDDRSLDTKPLLIDVMPVRSGEQARPH